MKKSSKSFKSFFSFKKDNKKKDNLKNQYVKEKALKAYCSFGPHVASRVSRQIKKNASLPSDNEGSFVLPEFVMCYN